MTAGLDEVYFDWLYQRIYPQNGDDYSDLLNLMYHKEFVWIIPNDDNRVNDGLDLREDFLREHRLNVAPHDHSWLTEPCSFLEALVALATRMEFEAGRSVDAWFWEMISNLGLSELTDSTEIDLEEVHESLDCVTYRNYEYDGTGGLFPLHFPQQDQRDVELWYQMNSYIIEQC